MLAAPLVEAIKRQAAQIAAQAAEIAALEERLRRLADESSKASPPEQK